MQGSQPDSAFNAVCKGKIELYLFYNDPEGNTISMQGSDIKVLAGQLDGEWLAAAGSKACTIGTGKTTARFLAR